MRQRFCQVRALRWALGKRCAAFAPGNPVWRARPRIRQGTPSCNVGMKWSQRNQLRHLGPEELCWEGKGPAPNSVPLPVRPTGRHTPE